MKKKIYFIISSVLQILFAIYIVVNAHAIVEAQLSSIKEAYSMFPIDFQDRMIGMLQNNGPKFIIFTTIIGIILNFITLIFAIKNHILRKKGILIAFSAICFLTSESLIQMLLSIVNLTVLLCLQRKNPEDFPEKKEMPKVKYEKPTKKEVILSIIFVLAYFSQFALDFILPENLSKTNAIILTIVIYVVLLALAIFTFKDRLKRDIKLFKENYKAYFRYVLPRLGIMYVIFIACNLIVVLISQKATSENQAALESMPKWFIIPAAVLWAPIVEELIFRGSFRRFIKNDKLFIVLSAIVFGLLHTVSETSISNVFIMAIPYAILGGFFAYIYDKTDNLCNNILAHAFHNAVGMLLMNLFMFII